MKNKKIKIVYKRPVNEKITDNDIRYIIYKLKEWQKFIL